MPGRPAAALTVGIAENNPQLFDDPLFKQLKAKHAASSSPGTSPRRATTRSTASSSTSAGAQSAGVTPLVTFEHARGDATICNKRKNRKKAQCKLPTAKQYETALRAFKALFPTVRNVVAWNEINHFTQPTYKNPKAAAKFTTIARKVFKGGTVVAADILDQADNTRAKQPDVPLGDPLREGVPQGLQGPAQHLRRPQLLGHQPLPPDGHQGDHQGARLQAVLAHRGRRHLQVHGLQGLRRARQLKATKYMFKVARQNKKIKRLYVYTWFGGVTSRFDAGLVAKGKARKAYAEVRKHVK